MTEQFMRSKFTTNVIKCPGIYVHSNSSLKRQLHVMVNLHHSRPIIYSTCISLKILQPISLLSTDLGFSIARNFDSPIMIYSWSESGEGYLYFRKLVFTLGTHDHLWLNSLRHGVPLLDRENHSQWVMFENLALQTPIKINPLNPRVTSI